MDKIKFRSSHKSTGLILLILVLGFGKTLGMQTASVKAQTIEIGTTPVLAEVLDHKQGIDPERQILPLEAALNEPAVIQTEASVPKLEEFPLCSTSQTKSYMFYQDINQVSAQMDLIRSHMTPRYDGLLVDQDGYLGVALGSAFGPLGSRYIFVLDSGIELPLIKIEEKADQDTINGCQHQIDESVIEFVLDSTIAPYWFGVGSNGYINSGNFNNHEDYQGSIVQIMKVLD